MELPNIHFQNFPIEFKEINREDFPLFEVGEKEIIRPNEHGFINDELQSCINLNENNTVVVNAAVGQGKTYSIIDIVSKYYNESEEYMIFIASPFVSLVQQYYDKVIQIGIPEEQIYRYEWIGTNFEKDAWNSRIQIITANSLLGDPGQDSLQNSEEKRNYINYLVAQCENHNKKVVFIFDEIHDCINNFKEEYIFNLWKWKNVIFKNFILSATYNEASKIVIEILAELTENKIQIIESERVKFPEKQSSLFLHFNPAKTYKYDNDDITKLVDKLVKKDKLIDILCFSKKLADDICNKTDHGIGKILLDKFGEIQNCTSDLSSYNERLYTETPQNRYKANKCNVGTNFKTGVSIEKENHAFIIIMAPIGRDSNFYKNNYGIFSNGINSVIQALARQRIKGEIHIILPPPYNFNYESLPFDSELQLTTFKNYFELTKNYSCTKTTEYKPLSMQSELISNFYNNVLLNEVQNEVNYIHDIDRNSKIKLNYPELKQFTLSKGEQYLSTYHNFFGKDLSSFIIYSAFTNQFINCNLVHINVKPLYYFKEEKIQWKLEKFWEEYFNIEQYYSLISTVPDSYNYFEIKRNLFNEYKVLLKNNTDGKYEEIKSFSDKNFEKQFIAFIQRKIYPLNREINKRFINNGFYNDGDYTRGDYFRSCISHSNNLFSEYENLPQSKTKDLIKAYRTLDYFRKKIIEISQTRRRGNILSKYVLSTPPENFFSENEMINFISMLQILTEEDTFIKNEVFEYKRAFIRTEDSLKIIKSFYTYLLQDFFYVKEGYIYPGGSQARIKIIQEIAIPNYNSVINFITSDETNYPESYLQSDLKSNEFEEIKKTLNSN